MKYNIHGFSQPRAVELNLSNDDLLVLRWFVDFAGTKKMKTILEEDGIYYWVNYTTVLEDLPVLKVSKQTLKKKHFDNLCNSNVLKHKHIKDGGSFSYYAYGINYDTLVYLQDDTPTLKFTNPTLKFTNPTLKFTKGCVENNQGVGKNLPNKDYSIKDYSISNKEQYFENNELNEIFIEFLNIRKKLKAVNSERAINSLINKLSKYDDETKIKMIEQSIVSSWKDVYPLKDKKEEQKPICDLVSEGKGGFQLVMR